MQQEMRHQCPAGTGCPHVWMMPLTWKALYLKISVAEGFLLVCLMRQNWMVGLGVPQRFPIVHHSPDPGSVDCGKTSSRDAFVMRSFRCFKIEAARKVRLGCASFVRPFKSDSFHGLPITLPRPQNLDFSHSDSTQCEFLGFARP